MTRLAHRTFSVSSTFMLACLTLGALLASAAPTRAQDAAFTGVIVEDNAVLRAGGAPTFYAVGELHKGDQVQVQGLEAGWYLIVPPTGVYSYIAKAEVQANAAGKTGVVTVDKAVVKSASVTGVGESYRHQLDLKKGASVQIVGDDGSFYKIIPPAGAHVYLAPTALRRAEVTPAPAVASAPAAPEVAAPTPTPAPAPAAPEVAPPIPAPTSAPAASAAAPAVAPSPVPAAAFLEAEAQFKKAMQLPLEDQPTSELLATYEALRTDKTLLSSELRMVPARIAQLQRNAKLAQAIKDLNQTKSAIAAADAKVAAAAAARAAAAKPAVGSGKEYQYDMIGQLLASAVYNGDQMPRLYRLVEPATFRTIAYIQPSALINPLLHLGKVVGINGESRYDTAMKLNVIEIKKIAILEPASAPTPETPAADTPAAEPAQ